MRTRLFAAAFASLLAACGVVPRGAAKAQESANELNTNARFGRMELAAEMIESSARTSFFEHRRAWGGKIRIADCELAGVRLTGQDEAEVTVRVAWYRIDEGDLHVTTLAQKWHQIVEGNWKLSAEARLDGDLGLIGEAAPADPDAPRPRNARFPTIRLTGADPEAQTPAPAVTE